MQGAENTELKRKFERKQTFYNEMQGISKKYFEFQQQVYYSPIKDINPNMIIKIQGKEQKRAIFKREDFFIINGQYQPTGERTYERLILQIVQTIPRPKKNFGIIYVNTLAAGDAYNEFKKVMELLPFEYLSNLTKIYVLQASFMNKAFFWLSFGTVTNYIKNKTVNIDTLKELEKLTHFDLEFLKRTLPKNVIEELARNEVKQEANKTPEGPKRMALTSNLPQMKAQQVPESLIRVKSQDVSQQHPHTFYSQIHMPQKPNKKLIIEYQLGPTGAPKVLQLLTYFFKNNEDYLKVQGLFRKSVSIDDETEILSQLESKNYNYLETVTNPHIIANALKRFLANLREPIIPYGMFEFLMARDSDPNYKNIVIESMKNLPKINKMTLFLLFSFLRKVIIFSEHNKMGENNICIVFGPCLMKAEVGSIKDLIYAKKIIVVASIILRDYQIIFGDIETRNLLRRNSYMEYRKDEILQMLNKFPESPKKQHPIEQQQPILLDKTSSFIKEALQEKEHSNYYLELGEAEEGIEQVPSKTQEPKTLEKCNEKLEKPMHVSHHIEVVIKPQEQSISKIKQKCKAPAKEEFTQI